MTDEELERKRAEQQALRDRLAASTPAPVVRNVEAEERARRESIAAGREAQARVDSHADPDWRHEADAAIDRVAEQFETFTPDDVWDYGGLVKTRENRALGPAMTRAAKRGVIVKTDAVDATRYKTNHGGMVRVWRSLIYRRSP